MTMFKYVIIIFLCYLATRFIFGFVIPLVNTTIQMRRKMKEMNDLHAGKRENNPGSSANAGTSTPRPPKSDYIDFEEVK